MSRPTKQGTLREHRESYLIDGQHYALCISHSISSPPTAQRGTIGLMRHEYMHYGVFNAQLYKEMHP